MDFTFKQYLEYNQDYKGIAVYNQPFWRAASVVAGVNSVNVPVKKNDLTTFILVHQMQISLTGTGVPFTFFDSRTPTLPMLNFSNAIRMENVFPFYNIGKGASFQMVCSDLAVRFSLLIQIVTQEKQR